MLRPRLPLAAVALAGLVVATGAAPAPRPPARFLLVYAAAGQQQLAQSRDGVRWSRVAGFAASPGERPSAARRGDSLYVLDDLHVAPEGIAGVVRRFRVGRSLLTELPSAAFLIQIGSPAEAQRSTAVTGSFALDPAGLLTAVYALRFEPETNACPVGGEACLKIRTATEAEGSDGTLFVGDGGNRAVVSFAPDEQAGDPAAFAVAKGYVVTLAGPGPCLQLLSARDLHGAYRATPGLAGSCIENEAPLATPSGSYRPLLKEYWLYGVGDGRVVRAVTRRTGRSLSARRFRPLRLPGAATVTSAYFAVSSARP